MIVSRIPLLMTLACVPQEPLVPDNPDVDDPTVPDTPTDTPTNPKPVVGPAVIINEVQARNDSTLVFPGESRTDWVEIMNVGTEMVDLFTLQLEDGSGTTWTGDNRVLAPGERLLLMADTKCAGPDCLFFGINSDDDELKLFGDDVLIDEVEISNMGRDLSLARFPDGIGGFALTALPTPGEPNGDVPSQTLDPADETLFVTDVIHQIRFELTPQNLSLLDSWDENEVEAEAYIDDLYYPSLGLRLKGSASFSLLSGKPAFKIDFNEFVPGERWRTLKAINLHNGNVWDPTRVRDHITYSLAREHSIMAPRVGWAEVYIGAEYYGIYMLIETHDDVMMERWYGLGGEQGLLLEPNEPNGGGWGWGDFGDASFTDWDIEESPKVLDPLLLQAITMADQLIGGPATDQAVNELWTYFEKQNLLRYLAWEAVTHHTDGYKAPNNWRVYVDGQDALVRLVPAGAEWTWDNWGGVDPWWFGGNAGGWCLSNANCKLDYAKECLNIADVTESMALDDEFMELSTLLAPIIANDPRSPHSSSTVESSRQSTLDNIRDNPESLRQAIYSTYPELIP